MEEKYDILLLGSGGREHALAWKMRQSPKCGKLWVAPGNGGTSDVGENVDLNLSDFTAVGDFCILNGVDYLVIGPEGPLVQGIVDHFSMDENLSGVRCIGPAKGGAILEGSKAFAKKFMKSRGIPTAHYEEFTKDNAVEGREYISGHELPVVLKADGLAAGKGVVICDTHEKALEEFDAMLGGKFGAASDKVVVEEFLSGIEFSVFVLTDGDGYVLLPEAKDYKRIGEGDTGLNTGGMGSVSPVPFVDEALMVKVKTRIIEPTIQGLIDASVEYRGFIFFGLINVEGEPYVIEYNCRLGDPEAQVVLPRIQNDLLDLFASLCEDTLEYVRMDIDPRYAVATVCVSEGYPGNYEKGKPIKLPDAQEEAILFHAGTKRSDEELHTNGGRVLAATAMADDLETALKDSRSLAEQIDFEGKYFRSDIGFDL